VSENPWLEDEPSSRPTRSPRHRSGTVLAATTCLLVVAVPVALIVSGGSRSGADGSRSSHPIRVGPSQSAPQLLSALNATTATGNFDVNYNFGGQQAGTSSPTTTTTTTCGVSGSGGSPEICTAGRQPGGQPVSGTATIDVEPFAMVATSQVSGFGTIVLRDNGTDVWEEGGGDYGLAPGSSDSGPGSSLTGFASLVEGTLGPRQGALAMLGLASPTGYLNLDPAETSDADLVGAGTVGDVSVNVYQISMTPAEGAQMPELTPQEQVAVDNALQVLHNQGYTGSTVRISVDAAGFIRRTQTTDHFADGTIMASEAEFSNFGCAGTVLMPGQSGSATPPAGCTSPDNPTSTAAPTTTVPASGSTTTFPSPTTTPPTGSAPVAPPSTTTSTTSSTLPSTSTSLPSGPTTTVPSAPPSSAP